MSEATVEESGLLLITVILFAGVYAFAGVVLAEIYHSYQARIALGTQAAQEALSVDMVSFGPGAQMTVWVYNGGAASEVSATVAAIYVNGDMVSQPGALVGLNQDQPFTFSYSWAFGGVYHIQVATEGGNLIDAWRIA